MEKNLVTEQGLNLLFSKDHQNYRSNAMQFVKGIFPSYSKEKREDIVASAFLDVLEKLDTLRLIAHEQVQFYFNGVCRNKAIDLHRKKTLETSVDVYPLSISNEEGFSISKQDVREAIDTLPSKQRALVEERFRVVGQSTFVQMPIEAINLRDCEKKQGYDKVAPKLSITAGNARVIFKRDIKPQLEEVLRHKMAA